MNNDFLVSEKDFEHWRTQKLKSSNGQNWWTCIDAYVIQAILNVAGPMGAFWPLMIYSVVLRQHRMKNTIVRNGWVKVSKQLLPIPPPLHGRTKVAALDTLVKAKLATVRRQTVKSAPEVKLLYSPKHINEK